MPFVTFDGVGGGVAGWLHPTRRAPTGLAVLLCGPFGDDAYGMHQGWRVLADMLAARGMPALRFDWPGTGDSAGLLPDTGVVAAWVDSMVAAAAYLRDVTGADRLALVGMRMGALLAARAAPRIAGLEALALLAQPASGRALVREWRLVHQVTTMAAIAPGQGFDVAGLTLSAAAVQEIEALRPPDTGATQRVLLVHNRPPGPVPANAITIAFDGYDVFSQDNLNATVPEAVFIHVAAWLDQPGEAGVTMTPASPALRLALRPALPPAVLDVPGGQETPVWFGPDATLFGILCTPSVPRDGAPATVLLSSGATHHIGNGRVNVLLARHLVQHGMTSLRMACPGAGESNSGQAVRPYAPALGAGVEAAVDVLHGLEYRHFAAFGLCSGGYVAFHAARTERRLSALVLLNMQVFDWRDGDSLAIPLRAQSAYVNAIRSGQIWRRVLGRDGKRLTFQRGLRVGWRLVWQRLLRVRERWRRQRAGARATPRTVLEWLLGLKQRGCRVLLVWGDADPGLDMARSAWGPSLRRLGRVAATAVLPDAQHVLNSPASQQAFLAHATAHLLAYPRDAISPPAATNAAASNTTGESVTIPPAPSNTVLSTGVAKASVPSSRGSPRFMPTSQSTKAIPSGPNPISATIANPIPSGMMNGSVAPESSPASTAVAAQNPAMAPNGTAANRRDSTE